MATTAGGLPYVEPSDLVSGWPAVSQDLAEELDSQLAAKAALAGATFTGDVAITKATTAVLKASSNSGTNETQFGSFGAAGLIYQGADGKPFSIYTGGVERVNISSTGLLTGTGSLGAFAAYTPALSGTGWAIGNGTSVGQFVQIGKIVHLYLLVTFGSTSTYGAGALGLSLPTTPRTSTLPITAHGLHTRMVDASAGLSYVCPAYDLTDTTIAVAYTVATNGQIAGINSTVPFTWGTGDSIAVTGYYETT